MDTVLVTGGAGYVGSHTCKQLAASGYRPLVYDNLSEGHAEFVKWGDLIEGDIADTDKLLEVFQGHKPSAVIHFAASAYVGESMRNPQAYYDNNVGGSLSLLTAMREGGCSQIVFSSTCAVYGVPSSLPISIDAEPNPISPYGRSKLMVEHMLRDVAAVHGIRSLCLRYFNAAGADGEGEIGERHLPETHLIPNAINAALKRQEPLMLFGDDYPTADGTCVRDYVHVTDLAAGHVAALDYLDQHKGHHIFNLGAGTGVSIKQVIAEIESQLDVKVTVELQARRPGDPAELTADISHTARELGWRPEHSTLKELIGSAIQWAKSELN